MEPRLNLLSELNADIQTSSSGSVASSRVYDAFGNDLSVSGSWKNPFGYAGQFGYQQDVDTSLNLLGHRYYDSDTGRFLTRDPIKDGRNWYGYTYSNAVVLDDRTGLGVYQWLYTGDWNASPEVYEAALDAAATQLIGHRARP